MLHPLSTMRLDLVLQTPDEVLAFVDSLPPADRAEVSPDWIARVEEAKEGDPWIFGFKIVERANGTIVGSCAFKGPPDGTGAVEIAYTIDPRHRGLGFATEAAGALVDFALADGQVTVVRGHTRHDNAASTRVLAKCGFHLVGDVIDPEDGLVCRWERRPSQDD